MNITSNLNFINVFNPIKNILETIPPHQKKVIGVVTTIFAMISTLYIAYRYCVKSTKNPANGSQANQQYEFSEALKGPTQSFLNVFKTRQIDLDTLPQLDPSKFNNQEYAISIKPQDMTESLMGFTTPEGRKGIAIHIRVKGTSDLKVNGQPVANTHGVLSFHERYAKEPTFWVGSVNDSIHSTINERHEEKVHQTAFPFERCNDCPFTKHHLMSAPLLEAIIKGTDPDFELC